MNSQFFLCVLAAACLFSTVSAVDHSTAYVSAGSIVSFPYTVNQQMREDVLNSTLLAQVAATGEYMRYVNVDQWYKLYLETLQSVGWMVPEFNFQTFSVQNGTNWTTSVLQLMDEKITDKDQKDLLFKSLKAFFDLKFNDTRVMVFNRFSTERSSSNFQILPVMVGSQNNISMVLGCFTTTTLEKRMDGFASVTIATLSESVYANYRNDVSAKLQDASITDVLELELV